MSEQVHSSLPDPRLKPTLTIPEAGALFGLGKDQAYRAVAKGTIPFIQLSERRKVVPTLQVLRMLGYSDSPHYSQSDADTVGGTA